VTRLRLSVALCTFNGAAFLPTQLATIAAQTRQPDEVVVCDDGSIDGTTDLLADFAARAPFPVTVHPGGTIPLGPAANFARAVALTTGDVVVLADQDDEWLPERLARVEAAYAHDPDLVAVFGDAELVDADGRGLPSSLWRALGITRRAQRRFRRADCVGRVVILCQGNHVTGATLSFRTDLRDLLLPVPDGWLHDHWFGILLCASGPVRMESERLIRYRLHRHQHTGIGTGTGPPRRRTRTRLQLRRRLRKDERSAFGTQAHLTTTILDRLGSHTTTDVDGRALARRLAERQAHLATRAAMPHTRHRLGPVTRDLVRGRYHRYSSGASGAVKDLFLLDRRAGSPASPDGHA
jgi:hypothetical protein